MRKEISSWTQSRERPQKYWKLYKRRYRIDAEQEAYQIIENGKSRTDIKKELDLSNSFLVYLGCSQECTFMNTCKCAALMFVKYKNMFANIFANILTFTNDCDRIRTDKQRGHEHGQPYLLLRQSIKQRAKP